eukprot:364803-Chlamydomonas_euryale.AAC.2
MAHSRAHIRAFSCGNAEAPGRRSRPRYAIPVLLASCPPPLSRPPHNPEVNQVWGEGSPLTLTPLYGSTPPPHLQRVPSSAPYRVTAATPQCLQQPQSLQLSQWVRQPKWLQWLHRAQRLPRPLRLQRPSGSSSPNGSNGPVAPKATMQVPAPPAASVPAVCLKWSVRVDAPHAEQVLVPCIPVEQSQHPT